MFWYVVLVDFNVIFYILTLVFGENFKSWNNTEKELGKLTFYSFIFQPDNYEIIIMAL